MATAIDMNTCVKCQVNLEDEKLFTIRDGITIGRDGILHPSLIEIVIQVLSKSIATVRKIFTGL